MGTQQDILFSLNESDSLGEKLAHLHELTRDKYPFLTRIAIALYDVETDQVRTFIYSGRDCPLNHYQAYLSDCYSLKQLADNRSYRLEQDLAVFRDSTHKHAQRIYGAGYRGSYTLPLVFEGELLGFVFFNADREHAFSDECLEYLDLIANLIGLLLFHALSTVRTLFSTVRTALDLTYSRDPETAGHIKRMSRYARLIARYMMEKNDGDDRYAEFVYIFAPLHDLGKVSIPDHILLKPGPLTDDEFEVMKTHAAKGKELAEKMVGNYGLGSLERLDILLNLILYHHEAYDGNGYPEGLSGENIPLEARIVAVADVFDALTSERPYKKAWSIDEALVEIKSLSGRKLDPDCVQCLLDHMDEVEAIYWRFVEDAAVSGLNQPVQTG